VVPSTRWGHSACVFDDKLYVLGGRNDHDVNDLYRLDLATNQWEKLDLPSPPNPRRRHSAVFISSSLVIFGGFDGEFHNDMHVFHTLPRSDKI
jgi:N-acetylneuraminic acid mutarotase